MKTLGIKEKIIVYFTNNILCRYTFICLLSMMQYNSVWAKNKINKEKITIYTEYLLPFQYTQGKQIKGIAYQNVESLLKCANMTGDYIFLPWNQALSHASKEKNTLLFSIARMPSRENNFIWLEIIGRANIYLYRLKKRNDIQINTINDLNHYSLGLLKNDFVTEFLINNKLLKSKNYIFFHNWDEKFKMFLAGRFDVIDQPKEVMDYQSKIHVPFMKNIKEIMPLGISKNIYVVINKHSDSSLIKRLKACSVKH